MKVENKDGSRGALELIMADHIPTRTFNLNGNFYSTIKIQSVTMKAIIERGHYGEGPLMGEEQV